MNIKHNSENLLIFILLHFKFLPKIDTTDGKAQREPQSVFSSAILRCLPTDRSLGTQLNQFSLTKQ